MSFLLTIAGAGEHAYTKKIESQVHASGLSEQVRLVGYVENKGKKQLFEDSDIVVVPSHTENFGLVVAEALAHGVPVIASRSTPWKRLEEVGCGLWVKNDPEALSEAIIRMSQMPLSTMGERGRSWMEREFSWDCVSRAMVKKYEELIAGRGVG